MGSTEEVIEARGGYRVVIDVEQGPAEPYNDFQSPLLRIDPGGCTPRAEHIQVGGTRPTDADEQIEEAARRWGGPNSGDWAKFERYLRAYHGVTQIETYWSESYWYCTYDSAAWREAVGVPEGSASLEEYKAWCEGEVYEYAVQKRVTWATEDDDYDDKTTWEDTPDGWTGGYYGREYAESEAREALDRAAPES